MTATRILRFAYWGVTVLMCGLFAMSATMYFTDTDMVRSFFEMLHYPTYLVYPLAVAKLLGIAAVLSRLSTVLKEWAYAGFFFDALLALVAHRVAEDGGESTAVLAIILIIASRVLEHFAYPRKK